MTGCAIGGRRKEELLTALGRFAHRIRIRDLLELLILGVHRRFFFLDFARGGLPEVRRQTADRRWERARPVRLCPGVAAHVLGVQHPPTPGGGEGAREAGAGAQLGRSGADMTRSHE